MQHANTQDSTPNLEMSLREHLLAAGSGAHSSSYPPPPSTSNAPGPDLPYQHASSQSPHDNMDAAQRVYDMGADSSGFGPEQPSKGKRELSTSKRAAQNRAAQRAFRQRKEGYIKKLEEQVREFQNMEANYRALQNENYQLREYILNLQSRLLETQSEYPPAPSHINLAGGAPSSTARESDSAHVAQDGVAQLQAAAAQAEAEAREAAYAAGPHRVRAGADEPRAAEETKAPS